MLLQILEDNAREIVSLMKNISIKWVRVTWGNHLDGIFIDVPDMKTIKSFRLVCRGANVNILWIRDKFDRTNMRERHRAYSWHNYKFMQIWLTSPAYLRHRACDHATYIVTTGQRVLVDIIKSAEWLTALVTMDSLFVRDDDSDTSWQPMSELDKLIIRDDAGSDIVGYLKYMVENKTWDDHIKKISSDCANVARREIVRIRAAAIRVIILCSRVNMGMRPGVAKKSLRGICLGMVAEAVDTFAAKY